MYFRKKRNQKRNLDPIRPYFSGIVGGFKSLLLRFLKKSENSGFSLFFGLFRASEKRQTCPYWTVSVHIGQ